MAYALGLRWSQRSPGINIGALRQKYMLVARWVHEPLGLMFVGECLPRHVTQFISALSVSLSLSFSLSLSLSKKKYRYIGLFVCDFSIDIKPTTLHCL